MTRSAVLRDPLDFKFQIQYRESMKYFRAISILFFAAALAANAWCRELPPLVAPPAEFSVPPPVVQSLPNHLQVVVIESRALPVVTLTLALKAGAEADPAGLPGTAQLVASLLDEGTKSRSAQQIARALDDIGAAFDSAAEWDDSWARLSVLSDHTPVAFELLADLVEHPAFAPAEVARERRQTLSALDVLREDPGYLADTLIQRLIFAGTPYSHPSDGSPASISRLTARDLRRFHDRYYQPGNAILVVVGDVTTAQGLDLAEQFLGGWKGREAAPPAVVARAKSPALPRVVVIDDPDSVQTEIRVANRAAPRDSPSYEALTVANQLLGGPAENVLFSALRTRRGLVYGASSRLVSHREAGAWEIQTSTRTAATVKTVEIILDQMKRLDRRGVSSRELQNAQDYLLGHRALEFETSQQIARRVLELMIYNLPLDHLQNAREIRSVSADAVSSAAAQYLSPSTASIVLVGNVAGFGASLKRLGPARIIPVSSVDFGSVTFERPASVAGDR
ncbi:MAG: M16 family metallopeptidase [Terriglobia bacterium]